MNPILMILIILPGNDTKSRVFHLSREKINCEIEQHDGILTFFNALKVDHGRNEFNQIVRLEIHSMKMKLF